MERRLKLIAKKSLRYAGKSFVPGDEFEASAKDARILKAIRKADDAVAADTVTPDEPVELTKTVRPDKYRTRRMKASNAFSSDDRGDPADKE